LTRRDHHGTIGRWCGWRRVGGGSELASRQPLETSARSTAHMCSLTCNGFIVRHLARAGLSPRSTRSVVECWTCPTEHRCPREWPGRQYAPGAKANLAIVPAMGFEWAYRSGQPPWDIGRPQPAFVRLAEGGAIAGQVIDVGCGTGEIALYLASRGLDLTGLDAAPTAIAQARDKATGRGIRATFLIADALDLGGIGWAFDVAIDSGFFHTLSDAHRIRFERGLHEVLRPGGRYFMLCFSDRQPGRMGPRRVSQAEIRGTFSEGWRIDSIVEERFATLDSEGEDGPLAWLASLTQLTGRGRTNGDRATP